jgi:hypothetical protein
MDFIRLILKNQVNKLLVIPFSSWENPKKARYCSAKPGQKKTSPAISQADSTPAWINNTGRP